MFRAPHRRSSPPRTRPSTSRLWIGLAAGVAVGFTAGCAGHQEREAPDPSPDRARLDESACYTVDLFDPVPIRPAGPDVPPRYAAFLGEWVGGAWNGEWCHDLLIYEVEANGAVRLVSLHAPNRFVGHPATAFRRDGAIGADNALRFKNDDNRHVYTLVPARGGTNAEAGGAGHMTGRRTGPAGDYSIVLTRKGG